jgi:membrane-bound lytic murein transglycosylase D
MSGRRPIGTIIILFCIYLSAAAFTGQIRPALSAVAPEESYVPPETYESGYDPDGTSYSTGVSDLIKSSQAKYLEGSSLLKTGEFEGAQESFNKAVDILLQSNWDLVSTPALRRYFQDLIQRIQQDESLYLLAPNIIDDDPEAEMVEDLDGMDLAPMPGDLKLRESLAFDASATESDIPITINEMVLKSLDFWLNRGRKVFEGGLVRSGQYRPLIEKIFREESIPLDLIYLAQVESMFRPHAVSKAKAKGIWQFGKGTAIRYGLKVNRDVDERSDPEKSTRAAARYLNDLFAMFNDWNLALAAYNWGEGKVQRLINSTGMNDFWQLVDLKRRLPEETKNHIPLIQASVILGRNPDKFGLPTELDPPLKYAEVSVSKPIDLRAAAKILGISTDELKKLNPSLRGLNTPANYPNFKLKVPENAPSDAHEQLASLPAAKIKPMTSTSCRHKVRPGDTLTAISARYHVTISELRQVNDLSPKDKLIAGSWIKLPACSNVAAKSSPTKKTDSAKKSSKSTKNAAARSKASSQGTQSASKARKLPSGTAQVTGVAAPRKPQVPEKIAAK